jgi:hypothetical protein
MFEINVYKTFEDKLIFDISLRFIFSKTINLNSKIDLSLRKKECYDWIATSHNYIDKALSLKTQ